MADARDPKRHESDSAPRGGADRWAGLVAQLGVEIAGPLTAAIEQIDAALANGKIDRRGLRAVRDEIERARQIGMMGQQLTRFATGEVQQADEVVALDELLTSVLEQAARKTPARGIVFEPSLQAVRVRADAPLLFGLLATLVDWALAVAHERIAFAIDVTPWPRHARIACRFAHAPGNANDAWQPASDSLAWHLLEQTAATMGLVIERRLVVGTTTLTLEFPHTVDDESDGIEATDSASPAVSAGAPTSSNAAATLAGRHILVVASRREMRVLIRDTLRGMNLLLDIVGSVDEAAAFCRESMPDAVVIESIQIGARFNAFRAELAGGARRPAFIEIVEQGSVFELAGVTGAGTTRVGRDAVPSSLRSALLSELAAAR
jgi:hypothetical protein